MFRYQKNKIDPQDEPELPHILQRHQETLIPIEEEVRYIGNMWNYCGFYHKALDNCVQEQIKNSSNKIYSPCKNHVEDLHNCYCLREPNDFKDSNNFKPETQECELARDTFLKCYFRQAEPWGVCHDSWNDIYRCKYRKNPSAFNYN